MSITIDEVERIAKLSKLTFTPEQKQKLVSELSAILDYLDQLKEVKDKVVESHFDDPDGVNLMRDDVAEELTNPEELLKLAENHADNGFFKVKSILE